MEKFPEEMNEKEFKEFIKELEMIGKTSKAVSFDDYIFKEHMKLLREKK